MQAHEFTLILTHAPNEAEVDELYSQVDDGTIATIAGIPQIQFYHEAPTLEDAIRSAIATIRATGIDVARVEIEPQDLAPAG